MEPTNKIAHYYNQYYFASIKYMQGQMTQDSAHIYMGKYIIDNISITMYGKISNCGEINSDAVTALIGKQNVFYDTDWCTK